MTKFHEKFMWLKKYVFARQHKFAKKQCYIKSFFGDNKRYLIALFIAFLTQAANPLSFSKICSILCLSLYLSHEAIFCLFCEKRINLETIIFLSNRSKKLIS